MNIQRQFSFPDLELRRKKTTAQMGGSLKDASNRQGFRWLAFAIVLCGTVISQAPATYADFFSKGLMAPLQAKLAPGICVLWGRRYGCSSMRKVFEAGCCFIALHAGVLDELGPEHRSATHLGRGYCRHNLQRDG